MQGGEGKGSEGRLRMQDLKMTDRIAGHKNAAHENVSHGQQRGPSTTYDACLRRCSNAVCSLFHHRLLHSYSLD